MYIYTHTICYEQRVMYRFITIHHGIITTHHTCAATLGLSPLYLEAPNFTSPMSQHSAAFSGFYCHFSPPFFSFPTFFFSLNLRLYLFVHVYPIFFIH